MAKRRHGPKDEILLVPFLDILCSLIGVLVLIIVVLCVSQTQETEGRTPEEIQMAQEHKKMKADLAEREKLDEVLKKEIAALELLKVDLTDKEQRYLRFRKLMDSSKEVQTQNQEIALSLQKELDDLLTEIDGLKRQTTESKKTIAELLAELKKRQVPEDKKVPAVVVQPSGSGMVEGTKVYFVECSGGSLKILKAWGEVEYRLSATAEVVVADTAFNHFLTEVQKEKSAVVLFLIRDDGYGAFNNGAGRAESDYGIRVGKLPIPGRGELDLAMFEQFRGKVVPPPTSPASDLPDKPKT
jgi:hypothetical protein